MGVYLLIDLWWIIWMNEPMKWYWAINLDTNNRLDAAEYYSSHVSGRVSPVSIVRIVVVLLHQSFLLETSHKEEEKDEEKHPLPDNIGNAIPHLIVEQMNFLESSDVILLHRWISNSPQSQIVHVRQLLMSVFKNSAVLQNFVLERWLFQVLLWP